MGTSVERLRIWLLAGAALLVAVIAGFLGYAHYRTHGIIKHLPGRMGATISKEFNGYTYSQSSEGKTIFTLHAAKAVQHKDGKYTLNDVNMVMYGRKQNRADRISGGQFEYDETSGVVHAIGLVHLDLQAPAPASTSEAAKHLQGAAAAQANPTDPEESGPNTHVIHVQTHGLVYMQKLGLAATEQQVDFAFGGLTGHSQGAEYSSDTGHVVLESAVTISGIEQGRPVLLTATHAELDRQTQLVTLTHARYDSGGETAQSDTALIHLRPDGTAERIEGLNHVRLDEAGDGFVTASHGDVTLDRANRPQVAVLTGNVDYIDDEPLRQARGEAAQATLNFGTHGRVDHVALRGDVHSIERVRANDGVREPWSVRDLTAASVDLFLVAGSAGKTLLREAQASGTAKLTSFVANMPTATRPQSGFTRSKLSGDSLDAQFIAPHGVSELSTVHGTGHTAIEQIASTGLDQLSTGDTLDATFREVPRGPAPHDASRPVKDPAGTTVEVATAVQTGDVAITRTIPATAAASAAGKQTASTQPEVQHATAKRAVYDQAADLLTLTGTVRMADEQSVLWADRVLFHQQSGDSSADGTVKVTYLDIGSNQPMHVLAAHAEFNHDAARATFYGADPAKPTGHLARLWQSGDSAQAGSSIEAPVLIFEKEQKRLTARGLGTGAPTDVHTVLVSDALSPAPAASPVPATAKPAGEASSSNAKAPGKFQPKKPESGPQIVRVASRQVVYSDRLRQAEFTGGVHVLDTDGDLRAQQATVFLAPAGAPAESRPQPQTPTGQVGAHFGGNVERIVASGKVDITQPGRRATGERLVYTAGDQLYVLTGSPTAPPKVVDAQQGTATGASLRFHPGDDSVVIAGPDGSLPGSKPHTETKVEQH